MEKLIITPKTKIYDLLEAYPELEDSLIELAPAFKKLKNPMLRKTITRITTLSQAATIGGLKVEEVVNTLRERAGQDKINVFSGSDTNYITSCPTWFNKQHIIHTIDIRVMLNAGEQPVHEVLTHLRKLKDSDILEIIAPFVPAPLIDKALSLGYKHWIDIKGDNEVIVYFGT